MQTSILSAYLGLVLMLPAQAAEPERCLEGPALPGALSRVNAAPGGPSIPGREGQSSTILMAKVSMLDAGRIDFGGEINPTTAPAPEDGPRRLLALITQYAQAQSSFDVEGLKAATADTFIEVSPVGEVDPREKVLGFYASGKKTPGPTLDIDDQDTRIFGSAAVVLARMTYSLKGPDGQVRQQALRACYVAYKQGDEWKLVSAQYTPIRQR